MHAHVYNFYRYNDIAQFGLMVTEKDGPTNLAPSSQKEPSTSQNATPVDKPTDLGRYHYILDACYLVSCECCSFSCSITQLFLQGHDRNSRTGIFNPSIDLFFLGGIYIFSCLVYFLF